MIKEFEDKKHWKELPTTNHEKLPRNLAGRPRIIKKRVFEILIHSKLKPKAVILDLGSGEGFSSIMLTELGYNVVAIDISKKMIVSAKKNMSTGNKGDNIMFVLGDAENLPFKSNIFDMTIGIAFLHHIEKDGNVIKEMKRVVKHYGIIAISEPNALNPFIFIRGLFHYILKKHEHLLLRSTNSYYINIFKCLNIKILGRKNIIFTSQGIDPEWLINLFIKIEPILERIPLLNKLSACVVIVGQKLVP